jgi:hypothetical protein
MARVIEDADWLKQSGSILEAEGELPNVTITGAIVQAYENQPLKSQDFLQVVVKHNHY